MATKVECNHPRDKRNYHTNEGLWVCEQCGYTQNEARTFLCHKSPNACSDPRVIDARKGFKCTSFSKECLEKAEVL